MLALEPSLLIADEPVSALDVSIQAQVINLFVDLQEQLGLTYLSIAHDFAAVRHISTRIAVMYLGRIVEIANSDDIYREPLYPSRRILYGSIVIVHLPSLCFVKVILMVASLSSAAKASV